MLSGSCYFRLWALLWVGWRDFESDWIFRADEPWKVQSVDVMPHSNCPGDFSKFRNILPAAARTRTQPWGNNSGIKMRQSDKMWARVIMAKCGVIFEQTLNGWEGLISSLKYQLCGVCQRVAFLNLNWGFIFLVIFKSLNLENEQALTINLQASILQ